jgi:hypothetical protein
MGLLEIVDQTFRLYRANFGLFFSITAVVYLPLGVLQSVPALMVPGVALGTFASLLALGALTKAVSDRYLSQPTDIGSAYRYIQAVHSFLLTLVLAYVFAVLGVAADRRHVGLPLVLFRDPDSLIEDKRYLAPSGAAGSWPVRGVGRGGVMRWSDGPQHHPVRNDHPGVPAHTALITVAASFTEFSR